MVLRVVALTVLAALSSACAPREAATPDSAWKAPAREWSAWRSIYPSPDKHLDYSEFSGTDPAFWGTHEANVVSSTLLSKSGEPVLHPTSRPDDGTIRLAWSSFYVEPVVVRVDRTGDFVRLRGTLLQGAGNYRHSFYGVTEAELNRAQWELLAGNLALAGFWEQPCFAPERPDTIAMHGDVPFLEAVDELGYHCMARQGTERFPHYRQAVSCLLYWAGPLADIDSPDEVDWSEYLRELCGGRPSDSVCVP